MEEAFGDGIVVAVTQSARAGLEIVLADEHLLLAISELTTLVGIDQDCGLGFAPPDCRERSLQGLVARHAGLSATFRAITGSGFTEAPPNGWWPGWS